MVLSHVFKMRPTEFSKYKGPDCKTLLACNMQQPDSRLFFFAFQSTTEKF